MSGKASSIFGNSTVDRVVGMTGDNSVYCTLSFNSKGSGVSRGEAKSVFSGRAPACNINITEQANISTDRSLSGDWLVMTFGMRLVSITITGLDIFYARCSDSYDDDETIQSVFNAYNCAEHPKARVTVSMKSTKESSVYKCILVEMEKSKDNTKEPAEGLGSYSISLLGVKQS